MSYGVFCEHCGHHETAHDPETGKCTSEWGRFENRTHCSCESLDLPIDAVQQREFENLITEGRL